MLLLGNDRGHVVRPQTRRYNGRVVNASVRNFRNAR
jgi:hypothetical protein